VDNLAHALVGAALGRAVADRRVPASGWIGAIAANAPDWSEFLIGFRPERGSSAYYSMHRGITHSFFGAVIETMGIAAVMWGLTTLWRRKRGMSVSPGWILALVGVAVVSHLYLDWQGSYGLRPFLPWSGRWTYADWVAIVDPLYWLLPLVALAWGAERHWRDLIPYVLLAALITVLLVRADGVATWLRVACFSIVTIGTVGWVTHWFGVSRRQRAAAWAIALLAVYAGAQGIASQTAKRDAQRAAVARFGSRAQSAALTRIGTPFQWTLILASADSVAGPDWAIARHLNDPWVRRALSESPSGRAFGDFARFLAAEVDSAPTGVTVTLRDARYALPPETGWGVITVEFPTSASRGGAPD
jgi:inner membrane protein